MSDETPVPGELAIGDHLAGYRLDEILARGGMAVVYRAFDERLGSVAPLALPKCTTRAASAAVLAAVPRPGSSRWSRAAAGCSWPTPAPGRYRP